MARATFVLRNGKLVEKRHAAPLRSIHVIRDEMGATVHMADGKTYTSKRKFRDATRRAGCVEVGNEALTVKPVEMDRSERARDVAQAFHQLEQGYRPPSLPHMDWE